MPTAQQIHASLEALAHAYAAFAIAWHVVIVAVLVALATGRRPGMRLAALLLAALPASVATFAWLSGNPFNGVVMSALVAALLIAAAVPSRGDLRSGGSPSMRVAGLATITFGLVYPHFLPDALLRYLVAAPVGLVPCPSLAVMTGFLLLTDRRTPRRLTLPIAAAGLFYGVFGVLVLGVVIDAALAAASMLLAVGSVARPRRPPLPR